jgi:hypothetical protein
LLTSVSLSHSDEPEITPITAHGREKHWQRALLEMFRARDLKLHLHLVEFACQSKAL